MVYFLKLVSFKQMFKLALTDQTRVEEISSQVVAWKEEVQAEGVVATDKSQLFTHGVH